jgi:hypothetical protein
MHGLLTKIYWSIDEVIWKQYWRFILWFWRIPIPSPASKCVPPRNQKGWDTLACWWGDGGVRIRTRAQTLWYSRYNYMYSVQYRVRLSSPLAMLENLRELSCCLDTSRQALNTVRPCLFIYPTLLKIEESAYGNWSIQVVKKVPCFLRHTWENYCSIRLLHFLLFKEPFCLRFFCQCNSR